MMGDGLTPDRYTSHITEIIFGVVVNKLQPVVILDYDARVLCKKYRVGDQIMGGWEKKLLILKIAKVANFFLNYWISSKSRE